MEMLFEQVWQPFLAWSTPRFSVALSSPREWKPSSWILRKSTWLLAILIMLLIVVLGLTVFCLGIIGLWQII
jgi:hypothetical protein